MKRSLAATTAVVSLAVAAVALSIGTVAADSPGEPAHANLPAVGRTPLPEATQYQICGPASAEPWHC